MNNPFTSDRNIFSKVVNPMKKREVEKKDTAFTESPYHNQPNIKK